ncbi:hypothetical protein A2U01_0073700, partial [Trifolium medium]|nr:hypothetical protein [Trifolium medium]
MEMREEANLIGVSLNSFHFVIAIAHRCCAVTVGSYCPANSC